MKRSASWFVTPQRPVTPRHLPGSIIKEENRRCGSWFRRLVSIRPGPFVLPAPDTPAVYDPDPPREVSKGEAVGSRHYFGRVTDVLGGTLALTLWEIPNGRELLANIAPARQDGVTTKGRLPRGTPVDVWTWTEHQKKSRRERLHIATMDAPARPRRKPGGK